MSEMKGPDVYEIVTSISYIPGLYMKTVTSSATKVSLILVYSFSKKFSWLSCCDFNTLIQKYLVAFAATDPHEYCHNHWPTLEGSLLSFLPLALRNLFYLLIKLIKVT